MLNNKLQILIDYYSQVETDAIVLISGYDLKSEYCSKKFANMLDIKPEQLIGRRVKDIKDNKYCQKFYDLFGKFNEFSMGKQFDHIGGLSIINTPEDRKLLIYHVINLKEIKVIKLQCWELQINLIGDVVHLVNQLSSKQKMKKRIFMLDQSEKEAILTEEEEEILFLLLLGRSYKDIALVLSEIHEYNINDDGVRRIIHNVLFEKFNCFSVYELMNRYLLTSYHHVIPPKLITNKLEGVLSYILHN